MHPDIEPPRADAAGPLDQLPSTRGAIAIISNSQGQLLLHLRDDIANIVWPGYWSVLGGGCDPGEHPDDAIVRELDEEAALKILDLRYMFDLTDEAGSGQLLGVYRGTWDGDPAVQPITEGQELRFFDPDELPGLLIPPHVRAALAIWAGV